MAVDNRRLATGADELGYWFGLDSLLLRLDKRDKGADVIGLRREVVAADRGGHDACAVTLDDLCVGGGDRLLEVGVVGANSLAVAEGDGAAGGTLEARPDAGAAGERVAGGAAVGGVEALSARDQRGRDGDRADRPGRCCGGGPGCRGRRGGDDQGRCSARVVLAAVVADGVRGDQEPKNGPAGREPTKQPAPESVRARVGGGSFTHRCAGSFHRGGEH